MKRRWWTIATVLVVAMIMFGTARAAPARRGAYRPHSTFYLIAGISNDPFYLTMYQGARVAARKLGDRLVFLGAPDRFSPAAQIPYVDLAIAEHAGAILIAPADRTAMNAPLKRAVNAGIPVITLDTSITAPIAVTHISSRNVRGGRLAAQALAQAIQSHGTVTGISVRRGVSTTDRRERGFVEQLHQYPNIQYLGTRYDNDIVARASSLTSRELTDHPALAGIFAMNSLSGEGVITALLRAHRGRQIKVVEFDTEPLQVYTLRRGIIDALIAQDPWTMGNLGVDLADRWVTGHRSGIHKSYFTRELIITRANVDNPALKRFLYTSG